MKFFSERGFARSRIPLIAMLALAATLGLAGCEGDGGPNDAPGPAGPGGPVGPPGPTGPSEVPISQGGDVVGMGNGSGLTAAQVADIGTLVATVDSAAVTNNKAVIELTVETAKGGAVLGLAPTTLRLGIAKLVPATGGFPSRWQSYINRSAAPSIPTPTLPSAIQANTESGVATGWQELGGGKYRYTSAVDLSQVTAPIAVPYEPSLTHRVSFALDLSGSLGQRALAPDNPFKDFVPDGSAITSNKLIAATEKCTACHVRFAEHGGPRRNTEFCAVCHNPSSIDPDTGESVDMAYMAHSIHRGEARTNPYVVYGFNATRYDFSEVTYPQPLSFCETCHTQSDAMPQGDDWMTRPGAASCGGCHDAGLIKTGPSATTGQYTYTYRHTAAIVAGFVAPDGNCVDCHRSDGVAGGILEAHKKDEDRKAIENGDLFTYKILEITDAEVGKAPKVKFQILGADGQPLDVKAITSGRLRLDFAWTTRDIHSVADVAGNRYQTDRGEAIVVDLLSAANKALIVDNLDGTFSYTLTQALPSGFSDPTLGTGLMVVLEGRRAMPDGSEAFPESAFAFAGGPAREKLVEQAKCESCHKRLAIHGGSRAGDPMMCTACHNSSVGGTWDTDTYGPLALGAFIHNLHVNKVPAMGAITYPQDPARCIGCHVEGKYFAARSGALPITVDAGTTADTGPEALAWMDDKADSATAGTCKACHDSGPELAHMVQNGGSFDVMKALSPSSAVESCAVCHGPGRLNDTQVAHCAVLPFGECTD
jgi:OmcA/MtrC family decaheme c-type cytochrome